MNKTTRWEATLPIMVTAQRVENLFLGKTETLARIDQVTEFVTNGDNMKELLKQSNSEELLSDEDAKGAIKEGLKWNLKLNAVDLMIQSYMDQCIFPLDDQISLTINEKMAWEIAKQLCERIKDAKRWAQGRAIQIVGDYLEENLIEVEE